MQALVVYDSAYGNTEKIARAIAQGIGPRPDVDVMQVACTEVEHLTGLGLLVVGSPTQKFRPLPTITAYLNLIPQGSLKGARVAAFDTRYTEKAINDIRILSAFVKVFGYAAGQIGKALRNKGGTEAAAPEGFYVADLKGPLLDGELERAEAWGRRLAAAAGLV